jgi:hypothetical protein
VTVDCTLPCVKHIAVVVLFRLDAALVLQFCQLGCTLLVHYLLQVAAHGSVTLPDLSQNVSLVSLLSHRGLNHLFLESAVLALNLRLHIVAFVLLHPFTLPLLLLLQLNVLLALLIHIFQQVDAGLVLTVPLLLALLHLLFIFLGDEFVNHSFISLLVSCCLNGEFLKFNCLIAVSKSFLLLLLLDSAFVVEG